MINEDEKVVLWLTVSNVLPYKKQRKLLSAFASPKELWNNFVYSNSKISEIITEQEFNKLIFLKDDNYLKNYKNNLKQQDINIVTLFSEPYPNNLKEIESPPLLLYYKGDISLLKTKCLAIVGTRKPTKYGKDVTVKFARAISKAGVTIVSGLAYGIDTEAHAATIEVGGKAIAVLGGGLNQIYPLTNIPLANKIIET